MNSIDTFLKCLTPPAWIHKAIESLELLLIDHAHCEKKAASTALSLMYRHPEHPDFVQRLSRLAREELRHFEKVLAIIEQRGFSYSHLTPSRYAAGLLQWRRDGEPERLIDTVIIAAFIEARSCERFRAVGPHLDSELETFYLSLLASEERHFTMYLNFAQQFANTDISDRVEYFANLEADLILTPDTQFRFHSGVPVSA